MCPTIMSQRTLLLGIGLLGVVSAGCGGSDSSTGPSGSGSVKRLHVRVASTSTAQAPGGSVLSWLAMLFSGTAEAQVASCQVSAGGVTGSTNANGEAVLQNVPTANGSVIVTIDCPPAGAGGADGSFTLTGLPNDTVVTVEVEVEPGQVTVKAKDVDVSPSPSPDPSPQVSPSPSLSQKKAG